MSDEGSPATLIADTESDVADVVRERLQTFDREAVSLLEMILQEMKRMNLHLAYITGLEDQNGD